MAEETAEVLRDDTITLVMLRALDAWANEASPSPALVRVALRCLQRSIRDLASERQRILSVGKIVREARCSSPPIRLPGVQVTMQ